MNSRMRFASMWILALALVSAVPFAEAGSPKGAKAIFDSGEGPASGMSVVGTPAPGAARPKTPAATQKYVGISYELLLLTDDGQIRKVPNNRTFKTGERLLMRVMTNRPGWLKIYNIGPTGNVNILAEGMVEAFSMTQVPQGAAMRFVGNPGVETVLIMLGDSPGAGTAQGPIPPPPAVGTASAPGGSAGPAPVPASSPSAPGPAPQGASEVATLPPPPPLMIASNIDGAKNLKGAKDLVAEDGMKSSFAVVSPQSQWAPVKSGTKDLVLESSQGTNYGVIPASAVSAGGILSLTVKLRHE